MGKTTLALSFLNTTSLKARTTRHPGYLNWDDPAVQPQLLRGELPGNEKLVVLDEIHKYPRWRNPVKGLYDSSNGRMSFLITGSARFENLVACQLLKYCHYVEDTEGYAMGLRFIRDTDRREVDFVVLRGKNPLFAVECKSGEKKVNPAIRYFQGENKYSGVLSGSPRRQRLSFRRNPCVAFYCFL